jgi:hypothetical protein
MRNIFGQLWNAWLPVPLSDAHILLQQFVNTSEAILFVYLKCFEKASFRRTERSGEIIDFLFVQRDLRAIISASDVGIEKHREALELLPERMSFAATEVALRHLKQSEPRLDIC